MKSYLIVVAIAIFSSVTAFSQENQQEEEKSEITPYFATGLSMTNGVNFSDDSYPSVEVGVMYENISVAGVFGRSNLTDIFNKDSFNNYWYEGKVAFSFPIGDYISGYGVMGIGTYIGQNRMFIEYGGGISKDLSDNLGAFLQVSNWDGTTYVTPGVCLMF